MTAKIIVKTSENENTDQSELQQAEQAEKVEVKKPQQISLNIRRGIDGRLMIFDHDHIDIVFLPNKTKLICFSKVEYSNIVYDTQMRMFKFLAKKGLVKPETIQGSNVYGSMEAEMLNNEMQIPIEHLLSLNIEKWLDSEKPALELDKMYSNEMTNPDQENSTELGEVPHEEVKGSIPKGSKRYVGGWW